jgi:hypothetical protein
MTDIVTTDEMTEQELARLKVLMGNPLFFPDAFKDYVSEKVRTEVGAKLPLEQARKSNSLFAQLAGGSGFNLATTADQTWQSTSADGGSALVVTVPGPSKALAFWSTEMSHQDANLDTGVVALSVNGSTPDQSYAIWIRAFQHSERGAHAQLIDLPNVSNTVEEKFFKYGTASYLFGSNYLLVFRIEL